MPYAVGGEAAKSKSNYSNFLDFAAVRPLSGVSWSHKVESVISLHAAFGFTNVLRAVGPVGYPANPGYSGATFFSLDSTANQTSFPPVADGNQTNYAVLTNVYDPGTVRGTQAASSLSVTITGVGLMQNGSEVALPAWIVVKPVNASFVMAADEPYDLQVCVTISDSPPLGDFTVALNESVNGQAFTGEMSVEIMPWPYALGFIAPPRVKSPSSEEAPETGRTWASSSSTPRRSMTGGGAPAEAQ